MGLTTPPHSDKAPWQDFFVYLKGCWKRNLYWYQLRSLAKIRLIWQQLSNTEQQHIRSKPSWPVTVFHRATGANTTNVLLGLLVTLLNSVHMFMFPVCFTKAMKPKALIQSTDVQLKLSLSLRDPSLLYLVLVFSINRCLRINKNCCLFFLTLELRSWVD